MSDRPDPPEHGPRPFQPDERPSIEYPCRWEYRVIGEDADVLRLAVLEVVTGHEHAITPGHTSRHGRFVSLSVFVRVLDEDHRLSILRALSAQDAVKYLL